MCIIVLKPKGVPMPSDEIIKACWDSNYEGFGLAYHGGRMPFVHIQKGAMTLDDTKEMIASIPNPTNKNVMLHFRFATQGKVDGGACHPLPHAYRIRHLRALEINTKLAFCHNGVFTGLKTKFGASGGRLNSNSTIKNVEEILSDTQLFMRHYLSKFTPEAIVSDAVTSLIQAYTTSKLAFLTPKVMYYIGDFVVDDGIYYSNHTYKTVKYRTNTATPPFANTTGKTYNNTTLDSDLRFMMGEHSRFLAHPLQKHKDRAYYSTTDKCDSCGVASANMLYAFGGNICWDCFTELYGLLSQIKSSEVK